MSKLRTFSYILLGFGVGVIVTSIVYERELEKPIGEDEVYGDDILDEKDEAGDDEDESEYEDEIVSDDISSYEKGREELERRRHENNKNVRTQYSRMYKNDSVDRIDIPMVRELSRNEMTEDQKAYLDYIQKPEEDDEPDEYEELQVERPKGAHDYDLEMLEPGFGVYLGEVPADECVELIWYDDDWTLADTADQPIPNPSEVVGLAALRRLADRGRGAEDGVIYVRNMKTYIDYQITYTPGSYEETVLGIFERHLEGAKGDDA